MPPFSTLFSTLSATTRSNSVANESQFNAIRAQWQNPNDILSILMIIGGDIVQRAIAQLSGDPSTIVPVAFSFGWVGYSITSILGAVGEGKLMPNPDCDVIVVNAKNGYTKSNKSWVIGRLVRDHFSPHRDHGLALTVFKVSRKHKPCIPARDWVYYSGIMVIVIQLCLAIIPGAVNRDWTPLIITVGGTILSLVSGALPQWGHEKWVGRRIKRGSSHREVVSLTRGNGSRDVITIITEGEGLLRLEDLATARHPGGRLSITVNSTLSVLWIVQLLTVAGLQVNAWYLLAIGSIGMAQNIVAAGARRKSSTTGIHLEEVVTIQEDKVFRTLVRAESIEKGVGLSLLPIFFPGGLRPDEQKWRDEKVEEYAKNDSQYMMRKVSKMVQTHSKQVVKVEMAEKAVP
ncbi:hypothetical protein C8Q75DRAFT_758731 [Abortiporus biennis]|nr:hypothetical protein C8Q75DRAFT_758731 [Abortiporus biennis]